MKRATLIAVCAVAFVLAVVPALAQELPLSAQLVEEPARFDGTVIEFTGEVVGEVMRRGDGAWIHLNDDAYMERNVEEGAELGGYNSGQAVWVDEGDLADQITFVGDYSHEGDIVRVTGVFNAACAEHGGDMDIHATELVIVTPGHEVIDPIPLWKPWLALFMAVLAAAMYTLQVWNRQRA